MDSKKGKGGRPKKENPRSEQLAVMCTRQERALIAGKAKLLGVSMSEYLREIGLSGKIDQKIKHVPKEILELKATLNHLAANINQLAKIRNRHDELNNTERTELMLLSGSIKELVADIKNHLQ